MKRNIIGYIEPKKIIEVVAIVEVKKLEEFFDSIKEHNFEDGYVSPSFKPMNFINKKDLRNKDIEIFDNRLTYTDNVLQNSNDVRDALKHLTEQDVIDFKYFTELLESDSKLNNPETVKIFCKFINLYKFERKCIFEEHKFSSIKRAIMTFGNKKDIDDFNTLTSSLSNNTKFLRMIGKKTLLELFTSNTNCSSIDKKLLK